MKNTRAMVLSILALLTTFSYAQESTTEKATEVEHTLEISSGNVKRFFFKSEFAEHRNIDIWFPSNYSSDKQYPVLYMHDGQMLFDAQSGWNAREWGVDETLTQLINGQKIEEVIVVGIWNTGMNRHSEYFPEKAFQYIKEPQASQLRGWMPNGLLADNYLRFVVEELKPFIDGIYPTKSDQANTYISGSSMGGLISLYAICEYPAVFNGAACISTHWIGGLDYNTEIPEGINEYLKQTLPSSDTHRVYFDYGTVGLDSNYPTFQALIDVTMQEKGYTDKNWITLEFEGDDHNEKYWAARLDKPFLFLLQKYNKAEIIGLP